MCQLHSGQPQIIETHIKSQGRSYHEGQTFIEEYWYANAYLVKGPAPLSSVCQVPT